MPDSHNFSDHSVQEQAIVRMKLPRSTRKIYRNLLIELIRRRAILTRLLSPSTSALSESGSLSDLADQASFEEEQQFTTIGRIRLREQLRDVQEAITFMEQDAYGLCIRCGEEIPLSRLRVQPAALLCVPCQNAHENEHPSMRGRRVALTCR